MEMAVAIENRKQEEREIGANEVGLAYIVSQLEDYRGRC